MSASNNNSAPRRPGVLGVHSVDHFCLAVPDLAVARDYYENFGLDVRERGEELDIYAFGHPHRWGRVVKGERKQLRYVSFAAFEDDMPRFKAHLASKGIALETAPEGCEQGGLWIREPGGILMQIRAGERSAPTAKSTFGAETAGAGARGTISRSQAPKVQPRRLAHVALFNADVPRAVQFCTEALGLRLSDHSAHIVAFMHAPHGSEHHLIAFVASGGPGLHHLSWDVGSVQEVGLGAAQMAVKGFSYGWGMGRHVLGSNYFHYVRDPWGSYCEYSADMDYIPVDQDWKATDSPVEDSMYLWGPDVPAGFVDNFELA